MGRLRLTVAIGAVGVLAMVWPAARGAGQAPPAGQPKTAQQMGSASGAPIGTAPARPEA